MDTTGITTLSTDHGVHAHFATMQGPADDQRVDEWDLKASRHALENLRELLHREPMFDLLKDQLDEAERRHRQCLAASAGR